MWAVGTVLAVTFALGGCGGDDDDKTDASPTGPPIVTPTGPAVGINEVPEAVKSAAAAAGAKADASGAKASQSAGALVEQASKYVTFASGDWFLSEAVKPTGTALKDTRKLEASLDWTMTYEEPNTEQSMKLIGHLRGLEAEKKVLDATAKKSSAKVVTGDIGGKKAAWTDIPGGNVLVLIALSDTYTVSAEFSGVDLDAALDLAKSIKSSSEAKFKAEGGVIADCQPGDSCASVEE
jgi:hypothetical protein